MRRTTIIAGTIALLIGANLAPPAGGRSEPRKRSCEHVCKRIIHDKWRAAVRGYGVGLLRARMRCESGSSGGYHLSTTGNGYWFAHQFNVQAWTGAGGRYRHGRPVGVWTTQPSRLEQDYRAVVWDHRHGGDAWPNCP